MFGPLVKCGLAFREVRDSFTDSAWADPRRKIEKMIMQAKTAIMPNRFLLLFVGALRNLRSMYPLVMRELALGSGK